MHNIEPKINQVRLATADGEIFSCVWWLILYDSSHSVAVVITLLPDGGELPRVWAGHVLLLVAAREFDHFDPLDTRAALVPAEPGVRKKSMEVVFEEHGWREHVSCVVTSEHS